MATDIDLEKELEKQVQAPESVTVDGTTVRSRPARDQLLLLRALQSDCALKNHHAGWRMWRFRTQGTAGVFASDGARVVTQKVCSTSDENCKAVVLGNGVLSQFQIEHGFGTKDVTVEVYKVSTGDTVVVSVTRVDENNVVIDFSPNVPAQNEFRAIIRSC